GDQRVLYTSHTHTHTHTHRHTYTQTRARLHVSSGLDYFDLVAADVTAACSSECLTNGVYTATERADRQKQEHAWCCCFFSSFSYAWLVAALSSLIITMPADEQSPGQLPVDPPRVKPLLRARSLSLCVCPRVRH